MREKKERKIRLLALGWSKNCAKDFVTVGEEPEAGSRKIDGEIVEA